MINRETLKDSIKSCIIAGACGDAFGMPFEGLKKEQIKEYYGTIKAKYYDSEYSRHTKGLRKGEYTDDTQLTIATIKAILGFDYEEDVEKKLGDLAFRFCTDILTEKIGQNFMQLYKNKELIGAGRATKLALKEILKGKSALQSGLKDAFGCGAAIRIAPIAVWPLEMLNDQGRTALTLLCQVVRITHDNGVGLNSANLVYGMIINLIRMNKKSSELDVNKLLEKAIKMADPFFDDSSYGVSQKIIENVKYFDEPIDSLATRIGTSGLANESVVFALFAFLKEPFDFDKLMLSCVRNGGDTDSIASIAGNFYGALNGFSAIQKKYIINLQDSQKLQNLVDEFAEVMVSEHEL